MSLSAYVEEITSEVSKLRKDVAELKRENRQLKELQARRCEYRMKIIEELVEDLIKESKQRRASRGDRPS